VFHFLQDGFNVFETIHPKCKAPYTARWQRGIEQHCPNLVPSEKEQRLREFQGIKTYTVTRDAKGGNKEELYDSLADMWSVWYREFASVKFPRLIIRFEDTLFHAEKVMQLVMECLGKPMEAPFRYHLAASKSHGHSADFVSALATYGRAEGRYTGLTNEDREYARTALDPVLLKMFLYPAMSTTDVDREAILNRKVADLVSQFRTCRGKARLVRILLRAGQEDIDEKKCEVLPTWKQVTSLYGDEPVVYGLETCEQYRSGLAPAANNGLALQPDPRVDGLFNSGTNAFVDSLNLNFRTVVDRSEYNIPGNKHVFLENRDWAAKSGTRSNPLTFLPIVLIRDPFRWMASMVRVILCA